MTEDLWCIITSFGLTGATLPAAVMNPNVNKTSQQFLVLEGLQESTLYGYCISAYDSTTDEIIGILICGVLKTTGT